MTRIWNNSEGGTSVRRFHQVPPYSSSHDRYLSNPPTQNDTTKLSNRDYNSGHDNTNDVDSDETAKTGARRRIPVACGRCRKRKIRCTGPQGDLGCVNCKSSGSNECQFNRVQSEEIPFRDNPNEFPYGREISREVQMNLGSRSYTSQPSSYPGSGNSGIMSHGFPIGYRAHPLSNYAYQSKSECYIPAYATEYGDDQLDYSLPGNPYSLIQDQAGISSDYGAQQPPRGWNTSSSHNFKNSNSSMFFDPDTNPYHSIPFHNNHYAIRNSISAESNNFSLGNMANSLPGTDRVLPIPPTSRSNSVVAASGLASLAQTAADCMPYNQISMKNHNGNGLIGSSSSTANYNSLSNSPNESIPFNAHVVSVPGQVRHGGIYDDTNNDGVGWNSETIQTSEPTLQSQDSCSELYYTSRKDSQGSQGTLSNGHAYQVPHPYHAEQQLEHTIARNPSMEMALAHRQSNASLRAA